MMASPASAKSQQPLHNFPLPSLWSKSHHRGRRHHRGASPPPERRRISDQTVKKHPQWESRRISVSIPRPSHPNKPPLPTLTPTPTPSDRKISIKIRGTHPPKRERETEAEEREREREADEREREKKANERKREREAEEREREKKANEREAETEEREADDELAKTWNLRPRKQQKTNRNNVNLPENKTICAASEETNKDKFSLSLSKTEIEEDLFAMTGSRPTRRPKKRPRTLQKQLDDIFPGMWLHSITPDSYKVNEAFDKP